MQFSQEYLCRRLEHERKVLKSGRFYLQMAAGLVVLNGLLVGYNLWRGWRTTDYLYLFIFVVWIGFFLVQRKILEKQEAEVTRLADQIQHF